MAWRWTARRWAISAFVLFHLSALVMWTMPHCAIKTQFQSPYRYYVLPLGLWQWWAVFAPDPMRQSIVLNAEVVDAKGMRYTYEFPRLADLPWWQKFPRYRNCKFTANMLVDEYKPQRAFTARHAVRQLGLGEEAFPLWVCLYIEAKDAPPPGTGASDPMATPRTEMVDRFQFASLKEVRP
jgi:hypothetical protein